MIRTTVIIPNFNGMRFLPDCIDSLKKQTADDFEVLVVDNGSSDGSIEWLSDNNVKYISLPENKGFAGGVNVGIKASDTEYILLLNNDTVAFPDFVEKLEAAIDKDSSIFAVSSMMIKASDHSKIDSAGDGLTILGWAYQRGIDEPTEKFEIGKNIFSACAGASIYRKNVFDKIGLFDEMHFAYLEDVDISYRAKLAGYVNRYCPQAKVYHLGSATSGSKYNSFKVRLAARNNIYLHYKNQHPVQLIVNFIPLLTGVLLKGAFFLKKGFHKDYWKGVAEGLKTCRKCSRVQRARHGFATYLAIEGSLFAGFGEYFTGYIKRHI